VLSPQLYHWYAANWFALPGGKLAEWTTAFDELNRPVSTSPVTSASWRLMQYVVKISGARIRTHDQWIRKRVCYPLHHSAPQFGTKRGVLLHVKAWWMVSHLFSTDGVRINPSFCMSKHFNIKSISLVSNTILAKRISERSVIKCVHIEGIGIYTGPVVDWMSPERRRRKNINLS